MQTQLETYSQSLRTAYDSVSNPETRKILSGQYDSAQLLIKQLNATE
jgi:hypothetical protein